MFSILSKHWKKFALASIIAGLAVFALARIYYHLTDDFRLSNITYEIAPRHEWTSESPKGEQKTFIDSLLAQKFYYIGKGAQSYAFGSTDGKYVLKFFKFKHLRPSFWLDILPPMAGLQEYRDKQYQRKERKLEGVFFGYRLAFKMHKQESGLLYIHLNTTVGLFPTVAVFDKAGWEHKIPLDDVVFIIQDHAETARSVIHNLLKAGDLEAANKKIDSIFDLYLSEYHKGIFDNDHGVMRNVGFVGEQPIHLDVGKLKRNESIKEPANYAVDLSLVGNRMAGWLAKNEPDDFPALKSHIETKISLITGKQFTLNVQDSQ